MLQKKEKKGKRGSKRNMSDYQKHISVCAAPEKHGVVGEKNDFATCIEMWKSGQRMHDKYKESNKEEPETEG